MFERPRAGERAVLVRVTFDTQDPTDSLAEFQELVTSAQANPVVNVTGRRHSPDPKYFVGTGKADKDQIQFMVARLLPRAGDMKADAADALACAICTAHNLPHKQLKGAAA